MTTKPMSEWTDDDYRLHAEEEMAKRQAEQARRLQLFDQLKAGEWRQVSSYDVESLTDGAEELIEEYRSAADGLEEMLQAAEPAADALAGLDADDEHPDEEAVDDAVDAMRVFHDAITMYDPDSMMAP